MVRNTLNSIGDGETSITFICENLNQNIHQRSCEINIVMCCAASMAIVFNIFCEIKRKSKTNLQPIYLMNFADFLIKSILIIWQFAKSIRYLNANGLLLNDRLQFEAIFSCKSPARV